jgi:hypothetical protein
MALDHISNNLVLDARVWRRRKMAFETLRTQMGGYRASAFASNASAAYAFVSATSYPYTSLCHHS